MSPQRFLFLQGPCSPFFARLGQALRGAGHCVRKVNFTVGDSVTWRCGQTTAFRGPMEHLPAFYAQQYARHRVSDIVLFGDCRPVHRPAIALAKQQGMRVHVFEEGYFRPHWITLERDGVNGNSTLPRDPDWYRQMSANTLYHDNQNDRACNPLPQPLSRERERGAIAPCVSPRQRERGTVEPCLSPLPFTGEGAPQGRERVNHDEHGTAFKTAFWKRAAYDVVYHCGFPLNPILHPGVQSHVSVHPMREYLGYVGRGMRMPFCVRTAQRLQDQLIHESRQHPFFLLPLQLDSDAQIVHHSPFASMTQAMLHGLDSFARAAPSDTRLVVKLHPLDPGLINYRKPLLAAARNLGVLDRVFFLESGNLPALLRSTQGVVTVNSTVGSSALMHRCPVIALGSAIYAIPGLTFQGPLDAFWHTHARPDKTLFRHFRNVVIARTQVNGGFYCAAGIGLAVRNAVPRLIVTEP